MPDGKRWTVQDRDGSEIYLTEERWRHITVPDGHPEMVDYERELQKTIRTGRRTQDSLISNKYYYIRQQPYHCCHPVQLSRMEIAVRYRTTL